MKWALLHRAGALWSAELDGSIARLDDLHYVSAAPTKSRPLPGQVPQYSSLSPAENRMRQG
ncbi:Uncharacterised protein [Vibrio cholerae]|nr:Uncharacterised protein [Vibrio cholerae]